MIRKAKIDENEAYKHFEDKLINGKYGDLEQEVYQYFKNKAALKVSEAEFYKALEGDQTQWDKFIKDVG